MKYKHEMISIQAFNKKPVATIKAKRNKVIKVINGEQSFFYVTKIMSFSDHDEFLWIQSEIGERLDIIKRINNVGILDIIQRGIVQAEVKQTQDQKTLFLTKRQVIGPTLSRILLHQNLAIDILMAKNIKQIIWGILALIVGGGGYGNLIITLQNLIFQQIGDNYRPTLNYFSFCGAQLLKFKKSLDKQQYLEIAMFIDEETLITGDLNRFQFKARNFALLILSLLLRKDPTLFIFHKVDLDTTFDREKVEYLYKKYVRPRIKQLLQFKILKNTFKVLNIPGLQDFIKSALNYQQKGTKNKSDWEVIHKMLLENPNMNENNGFNKIPRLLWQQQQKWVKDMLNSRGLGIGENGQNIYMAFKISAHLECLLQFNDWKSMMKKLQYNYKTHEMFYRLLKCTTLKNSKVLQESMNQLIKVSRETFKTIGIINEREVVTQSYQRSIINDYLRYV